MGAANICLLTLSQCEDFRSTFKHVSIIYTNGVKGSVAMLIFTFSKSNIYTKISKEPKSKTPTENFSR